jgi:hypothetical protein
LCLVEQLLGVCPEQPYADRKPLNAICLGTFDGEVFRERILTQPRSAGLRPGM